MAEAIDNVAWSLLTNQAFTSGANTWPPSRDVSGEVASRATDTDLHRRQGRRLPIECLADGHCRIVLTPCDAMCSRFRDEIEMLPIASRAGNDRNANAQEALDLMYGWMTSRHEGYVSAMLTESVLSIASRSANSSGWCNEMEGARR